MPTPEDTSVTATALRRSSRCTTSTATLLSLDTPLRPSKRAAKVGTAGKRQVDGGDVKPSASALAALLKGEPSTELDELERPKKKRRGPYAHLGESPLTDRIKDGLDVLFCGENPGIRTAELQLHYASPHNHFYKCLHAAGLTPSVLPPTASRTLPEDYNIGITNLIARPTREASELKKDELEAAVPVLLRKVAAHRPSLVAFVGMGVCDNVLRYFTAPTPPQSAPMVNDGKPMRKVKKPPPFKAKIGLQSFAVSHPPSSPNGERTVTYFYCLPSTSGRVAAYPLPVKLQIWAAFGAEVAKLRASPPLPLARPADLVVHSSEELELPVSAGSPIDATVKAMVQAEDELLVGLVIAVKKEDAEPENKSLEEAELPVHVETVALIAEAP